MTKETVTVRMSRGDAQTPWGFRLHGGSEFGRPLTIEHVIQGSLADRAGLHVGDHVTTVAGRNAESMTHSDAQTAIRGAHNNVDLVVIRDAPQYRQWQPMVMPNEGGGVNVSLKHHQTNTNVSAIGTGHNTAPKPFGQHQSHQQQHHSTHSESSQHHSSSNNTASGGGVQHLQYNSPSAIYSDSSKQEALSRQTGHVVHGGADSNFQSHTLQALREEEQRGIKPTYTGDYHDALHHSQASEQSSSFNRLTHNLDAVSLDAHHEHGSGGGGAGAPPMCANCGKPVTGVYAKAAGMVFHAHCYSCATCGSSLKNVGYQLISNKLYCNIHAQQVKQQVHGPTAPVNPGAFFPSAAPLSSAGGHSPNHDFYQPEVMSKGPGRPVVRSTMDPHVRGVPTRPTDHAAHTVTNVTHTSSHVDNHHGGSHSGGVPSAPFTTSAPAPHVAPSRPADFGSTQKTSMRTETTKTTQQSGGSSGQQFSTPRRGKGTLKQLADHPRIPVCEHCTKEIRGPFVLALNSTWCPDHFVCGNNTCHRKLLDIGFVEENNNIYCEYCFEQYFAPRCGRCEKAIVGDSLRALNQNWHPDCFTCTYCHKAFGREAFFLEDGKPYCEADWNKLYTTKCEGCQFPIEAGDRWVEALGHAYHSDCFACNTCQKNLEGLTFFSKGGKPYCKAHA